jgi:lysophospholipase L1-like esterase
MNQILRLLVVSQCLLATAHAAATSPHPALIPAPARIEWREGALPKDGPLRMEHVKGLPPEGYEIEIAPSGAVIRSSAEAGAFYARQTLQQLRAADGSLPCVLVQDAPRFAWRGLMLDSSRHFQTVDDIKRWLDLLAIHKLNVFHWHLVDDHGWRFESKKYPMLTQIGAWREQPPIGRYGGFYTQQEMREVVAYAAKLHITVLPEIEMPGHSRAALASYPNLACGGTRTEVDHFFDFPMGATRFPPIPGNNVFCAANEDTFRMLEAVLTEVMEVFPSQYIHCGGDEVPMSAWNDCKDCQTVMKARNLANGHKLQAYFMGRIETFLKAHGRKMIGWDEILDGGLTPAATVMSWRGISGGIKAAKAGHDAVMSPEKPLYFDHRQSAAPQHPPGFGGSIETLEEVYQYDPVPKELTPAEAKHILGTQANLWSCATETTERLELFAFPRLCALAEIAWCPPAPKDFSGFQQRLAAHFSRLDALGVNYWTDSRHFQAGVWSPNPAFKDGTSFELAVNQSLAPGKWMVAFNYQKGADALTIESVELLADGKVVARDVHEGTAGAQHIDHQYTLVVPGLAPGARLVLRAKVHVTPWSGGGNGDSTGTIAMSQASTVCLFAPELPLPVIRATTPVTQDRDRATYDWAKRHQQVIEQLKTNQPEVVVIGDSITHYWAGQPAAPIVRDSASWQQAFGERVVANLGFGWDRTENVLWRIDHGELDGIAPKLVIVLIGTNNLELDTPEQVLAGIDAVCRRIHAKLPDARILQLGILPRKDQANLKADLDKVNYLLKTRLHPRSYIDVLDLGNKFRNADGSFNPGLFSDGLHPNAAGYAILGEALSAFLTKNPAASK